MTDRSGLGYLRNLESRADSSLVMGRKPWARMYVADPTLAFRSLSVREVEFKVCLVVAGEVVEGIFESFLERHVFTPLLFDQAFRLTQHVAVGSLVGCVI